MHNIKELNHKDTISKLAETGYFFYYNIDKDIIIPKKYIKKYNIHTQKAINI